MKAHAIRLATLTVLLLVIGGTVAHAAVTLAYFRGVWLDDTVRLEWGTGSELDHAYFNVWRSTENLTINNGQIDRSRATKLNTSPITAPTNCQARGSDYEHTDTTVVATQGTYYYYLESVHCTGTGSEFAGAPTGDGGLPVSRGDTQRTYLPFISRDE